jgi:hypothetical protein
MRGAVKHLSPPLCVLQILLRLLYHLLQLLIQGGLLGKSRTTRRVYLLHLLRLKLTRELPDLCLQLLNQLPLFVSCLLVGRHLLPDLIDLDGDAVDLVLVVSHLRLVRALVIQGLPVMCDRVQLR